MSARILLILLAAAVTSHAQAEAERERMRSASAPLGDLDLAAKRGLPALLRPSHER